MPSAGKPRSLKQRNRRIIINLLRNAGELSVAEISQQVRLSKTTVMKILNFYVEEGFVRTAGKGESTGEGGKRPNLYKFNNRGGFVFACHIFPDALYSVITDLNSVILRDRYVGIDENEELERVVAIIVDCYDRLVEEENVDKDRIIGAAVGAHGITDYNRGVVIHAPHFQSWGQNVAFKSILGRHLDSDIPIFIDNQIRFQVFAEKVKGKARDKKNVVAIEGGAGLVAGIIVKDEIKRGVHYLAGEIGHMILDPNTDERCACGATGCFEAMVTTKRLLKLARENYIRYPESLIFKGTDHDSITVEGLFSASNQGDRLARIIMDDAAKWFALGLSNLVLTSDPEVIILQGIFAKAGDYFIGKLREQINSISLFPIKRDVQIEYSEFGAEVGVVGAAAYVVSEYFK
jgi:predicted NBD/HSP70 family sugar kinase